MAGEENTRKNRPGGRTYHRLGDLLIASLILKNKMPAGTLYLDHPTEIGLVCFTR